MKLHILAILLIFTARFSTASIVNIGDDKPMVPLNGRICGIGDMNKDGNTDVIMQQRVGGTNKLVIYLQTENGEFKNTTATETIDLGPGQEDVFCNVGDFNGDACPDLLVVQQIAEDLDLIDKLKAIFATKAKKYQAKVFLNERDGKFVEMPLCSIDGQEQQGKENNNKNCQPAQFIDHPILVDVNGDGISDIMGFETKEGSGADSASAALGTSLYCRAGTCQEAIHAFKFKPCEEHFPTPRKFQTGFTPIFTDLNGDLAAELAFIERDDENSSSGGGGGGKRRKLVVWSLKELSDSNDFRWEQNDQLTVYLPNDEKKLASPLVGDIDSDGIQEIVMPICDNDQCTLVSSLWCYKYNVELGQAQWHTIAVDLNKATIHPEIDGDTVILFRIGDFSQNGFPDLIGTMSQVGGGMPVPLILENVLDSGSNFTRKFQLSQKPQRIIQKDVQNIQLSSFFDLNEDGNLDILYEYAGSNGPMVNFIKCDDKGDTTFLKVQIFTGPECTSGECCNMDTEASKRVKIGSGVAWAGACVSIKMADSSQGLIEQGMRNALQCQIPQTSHRILHNPFVLFGLSRSPNFVEEVHLGAPRLPSMGKNQQDFIRQIVPNSRVIVIPPDLGDRNGSWQSRLYVTPSRLIILSILVMVSMCIILLILIGCLHMRERHEDKKEQQAQTHRFHFDAM